MRTLALGMVVAMALPAAISAQTLQQRIDDLKNRQAAAREEVARSQQAIQRQTAAKMNAMFDHVRINHPLRDALAWWSAAAQVPLVINWEAMELEGVDPEAPVEIDLTAVPVREALRLIMQLGSPETEFVWDVEPGYVHLMSKAQANRIPMIAVYDVMDLLMEVPNFTDVPEFDLSNILEGGGTSGGTGGQLFRDSEREETRMSRAERGEQLAQLVRDSIEPLIWDENGGTYGHSVRYWNGRLIVRAPKYVQRQIGIPEMVRSIAPRASRE